MNVIFERGSARDPWRSPLSTEMNDASTRRIDGPVVQFVVTLFTHDVSCCNNPEQNVFESHVS